MHLCEIPEENFYYHMETTFLNLKRLTLQEPAKWRILHLESEYDIFDNQHYTRKKDEFLFYFLIIDIDLYYFQ